jgi:hypothetical protein
LPDEVHDEVYPAKFAAIGLTYDDVLLLPGEFLPTSTPPRG